jgi:hypothetical protein
MQQQEKIFLLSLFLSGLLIYTGVKGGINLGGIVGLTSLNLFAQQNQACPVIESLEFTKVDNQGNRTDQDINHVIIFDPKSEELDFKVSVGLAHKLYAKDFNSKVRQDYVPKQFREIISDENSRLDGNPPIAAINGDYVGKNNQPQGLNVSKGVEYSGPFKNKRSSFAISGGKPKQRKATIWVGERFNFDLNYNTVGGNGRFYKRGRFRDICNDLGDYGCRQKLSRSMAAITSKGYVILLVNNANLKQALYPSMFDDVLKGISYNYCLGRIREGILFDGGYATGLYYNGKIYVENTHPVGSVFLIYKKN